MLSQWGVSFGQRRGGCTSLRPAACFSVLPVTVGLRLTPGLPYSALLLSLASSGITIHPLLVCVKHLLIEILHPLKKSCMLSLEGGLLR
jgi:hypothetical protein